MSTQLSIGAIRALHESFKFEYTSLARSDDWKPDALKEMSFNYIKVLSVLERATIESPQLETLREYRWIWESVHANIPKKRSLNG